MTPRLSDGTRKRCLGILLGLLGCVWAATGEGAVAAAPKADLSEQVQMTLNPEDSGQPGNIRFFRNHKPLSLSVPSVQFLAGAEKTQTVRGGDSLKPAATIRAAKRAMSVAVSDAPAEVTFVLGAHPGQEDELSFEVDGCDRVLAGGDGQFFARPIRTGEGPITLSASAIVLQDRQTQDSIMIAVTAAGQPPVIRISPSRNGARVYIPWAKQNGKPTLAVSVRPVCGDATLALESAPVLAGLSKEELAAARKAKARPVQLEAIAAAPAPAPVRRAAQPPLLLAAQTPVPNAAKPEKPAVSAEEKTSPPADTVLEAGVMTTKGNPSSPGWHWFTGTDRAFSPLLADTREAQVRWGFMADDLDHNGTDAMMDVVLGGDVVIAEYDWDVANRKRRLTISGRTLITGRLDFSLSQLPIMNTDYYGGLAVGYRDGRNEYEAFVYHESSHIGDEMLTDYGYNRIDYSREAIRLLYSRYFLADDALRLYGGGTFNLRASPKDIAQQLIMQLGGEYNFSLWDIGMYLAADLKCQTYNSFYPNVTAQYGIDLQKKPDRHRPRLFLEFFHGYSAMGQFWDKKETYGMVGFGYNF